MPPQLLKEQIHSLREQERLLHRRLRRERAGDMVDVAEAKKRNREAFRQEKAAKDKRREEARRIQRYNTIVVCERVVLIPVQHTRLMHLVQQDKTIMLALVGCRDL